MDRRRFSSILAGLGLLRLDSSLNRSAFGLNSTAQPEILHLSRNGWMPNNAQLPVLLYRGFFPAQGGDPALQYEQAFQKNGWPPQWRNGVYDFHHYHSTAHEVLGFAAGHARLMLGGENGHEVTVQAGDVVVLPTGTGHCKLDASANFLVVGAYPAHQTWDICRSAPDTESIDRMIRLPFPKSDPVSGSSGALVRAWRAA